MKKITFHTESEDNMSKLPKKLTSLIIVLLGLLITAPSLFADGRPTHHNRTTPRQTTRHRQYRRNRITSFLHNLRRSMMKRRFKHRMRQSLRRKAAQKMYYQYHWRHNNYRRGCIRP
jgi:hypothetical protein